MNKQDKKLYLALNQKMVDLHEKMKTVTDPEELALLEKKYRKALEEANAVWDTSEVADLFSI